MRYVGLAILLAGGTLLAQTSAPAPSPAFEVASVKLNTSGSTSASTSGRGGAFIAINTRLLALIARAYRLREFQVTGGPDWINADRFDVNARAPEGATADNASMLRTLLLERFKLVAHTETSEQPIYALVVARGDGRLGPQLRRSTVDCTSQPPPSNRSGMDSSVGGAAGKLTGIGQTPQNIAAALGNSGLSRLVVDRTKLMGTFDFELQWTADTSRPAGAAAGDAPSLFTALQEQLGLKLEAQRGPVEFLVIDSVGRPTPD